MRHTRSETAAARAASRLARYEQVRALTRGLAAPLSEADCQVQSMPDASPTKWHLAHTTWFFETFLLERCEPDFKPFHPAFRVLFNSYYNGVGQQHPRAQRGLVTRPSLAEVLRYRAQVDERMGALLHRPELAPCAAELVELGLQHEQQHQELILTDLKHLLSCNPLAPAYLEAPAPASPSISSALALAWVGFEGGLVDIGHGGSGFAFDNETPRHRHYLRPYEVAARPVSWGEWRAFIDAGGYREPRWWLSAGWDWVRSQGVAAPLHMRAPGTSPQGTAWQQFTLRGASEPNHDAPVVHVSLYEADAFARWWSAEHPSNAPARLPTEAEWEHAAAAQEDGAGEHANLLEAMHLHPRPGAGSEAPLAQLFGDVWEWTSSSYTPYPGFTAWAGAVGEYNAKFMVDQYVLRGGSCATPASHIRASYRNFFPAGTRWQFSGLRLARNLG